MKLTIIPTEELYPLMLNGVEVLCRIWSGLTSEGVPVEAYVVSVVPKSPTDVVMFAKEIPDFMKMTRDTYQLED